MKIALTIPGYGKIDSELPTGVPTGGLSTTGVDIIRTLVIFIVVIAILLTLYFIIKGGVDIIQSQGQKEKLKSGRERVLFAILGLFIIFVSFVLMNIFSAFFGYDLLCILFQSSSSCF